MRKWCRMMVYARLWNAPRRIVFKYRYCILCRLYLSLGTVFYLKNKTEMALVSLGRVSKHLFLHNESRKRCVNWCFWVSKGGFRVSMSLNIEFRSDIFVFFFPLFVFLSFFLSCFCSFERHEKALLQYIDLLMY